MKNKMKRIGLVVMGVLIFWILHVQLKVTLVIAILVAWLVYFIAAKRLKKTEKLKEKRNGNLADFKPESIEQRIFEARNKVSMIRQQGAIMPTEHMKNLVVDVCQAADLILDDFKKDPNDIYSGQRFMNYYLDTAQKIVKAYAHLANKKEHTDQEKEILIKTEETLKQMEITFRNQLGKLQEDNYMDLDIELDVLSSAMDEDNQ